MRHERLVVFAPSRFSRPDATAVYLSFGHSGRNFAFLCPKRAREGLAQPQACRAGDVSAAPCLQVAAGEPAAATRLRQARP